MDTLWHHLCLCQYSGICGGRHLANRGLPHGYDVVLCLASPPDALDTACKQHRSVSSKAIHPFFYFTRHITSHFDCMYLI
jgi:hypothetical protein